ncbi:MAG: peptide chain release factor N(5)-glutamine methyltransferase [Chloracidobacterium sp.]|nr:peptide chain release factor N(5)-glutamine methyltransferase [Chloracidobacterium sp.]
MNICEAIAEAGKVLDAAGVAEGRREAASLLAFVLGCDKAHLFAHPEQALADDEAEAFRQAVGRRAVREPMQYITGRQEFWRLEFLVRPGVLIPRPETEILVEEAVRLLATGEHPRFCEVGTGSGCIAVSILHSVPEATAIVTEISAAALDVASENARRHGVAGRLELREADTLDGVEGTFDLVVSNPPYVPDDHIAGLQAEVRDFEPLIALSGGEEGLDTIIQVISTCPPLLIPGGHLLMEIGFDQSEPVRGLLSGEIWRDVEFLPDLQGIPRILRARLV